MADRGLQIDCMVGIRTVQAASVARTPMPWTVTSVEQQAIGQDQGKPATERLGDGVADLLTCPARYFSL